MTLVTLQPADPQSAPDTAMVPAPGPALQAARERIREWQDHLARAGLSLRPAPPEPQTCCGRGCNGCVWESFYDALAFWCEDAQSLMATSSTAPHDP